MEVLPGGSWRVLEAPGGPWRLLEAPATKDSTKRGLYIVDRLKRSLSQTLALYIFSRAPGSRPSSVWIFLEKKRKRK